MSQLSFLAIDFETANPDQASVCQVGVAKVVNGAIVESTSWLVKPPTGIHSFEPRFIRIHGITPKHVSRSGISWQDSLQRIHQLADDLPLVAHNVSFDRTVYRRASERVGVTVPPTTWFDTLIISRRFITAPNHRLPTVATALDLPEFQHHQAEADAITCARIAIELSQRHQLHSISELWDRPTERRRSHFPARRFNRVGDLPDPNPHAEPQHPLHGHHVVITGDLNGFARDDFIIKVAELGAQPQLNVTKKTTMLVVAEHDVLPTDYDPTHGTSKEKKAHEYRLAGQRIELVAGRKALEMLTLRIEERVEPAAEPLDEPVELPVQQQSQVAIPTPPRNTPPSVQPAVVIMDEPVDLPVLHSHQQLPKPAQTARPSPNHRVKREPSFKNIARVVRPLAWCLVGVSALLVFVFLLGATGTAFSNPEFTVGIWILAVSLMTPILAAPGLLGWYLLRRYPAAK